MTNEEIQQKADELSKQYNCKVHPLVFKAEDEAEEIIGYLKEPQRQVKTSLMDRGMTQPVTACAEILEAYLIKEHSDSRIYDGVSENDRYYHGAVLEIYNMVKVSTNQFKKIEDNLINEDCDEITMWTCLVQFYHGVNPNTLDDDEFVEHIVRLKWSLQKTNQWKS